MKNNSKTPRSWQKKVLIAVCVLLAIVLAAMIALTIYAERMFSLMNRYDESTRPSVNLEEIIPGFTGSIEDQPTNPDDSGAAEIIESEEHVINILLVGADRVAGLADATILCTVDTKADTITLTSFQRDMYVTIPGYFPHKFNTSYALGGFELINETLEYNFGVTVDGNVAVNFAGFIDVINAIGGVDIELTSDEAWYMNTTNWDGLNDDGWALTEGWNHLNGDQALAYSRIRYIDTDFARNNRQRTVLNAIFEKCKTMNLLELNDLLTAVLPLVTTDMSNSEITGYAFELFPMLGDLSMQSQQIPAEDTYYLDYTEQDGGMSIVRVSDVETNRKILEKIITGTK